MIDRAFGEWLRSSNLDNRAIHKGNVQFNQWLRSANLAERADEYDGAKALGEVAGHGGRRNFKVGDHNVETTAADLGLRRELHKDDNNEFGAWIEREGLYQLGTAEIRREERAFGDWIKRNDLSQLATDGKAVLRDERAAAMWANP